jgi:hypothetical protein
MQRLLVVCFFFLALSSHAQMVVEAGVMPSINLNKKLNSKIKLNFKVENRLNIYSNLISPDVYELTDASLIGAYKVNTATTLGLGYLLRYRSGRLTHRSVQQFSIVQYFPVKIAHRIVTDQTFAQNEDPTFRLRYRIGTELPLFGKTLNNNELYFKVSNEYLGLLNSGTVEMDIRLCPFLGYSFSKKNKVEIGLDHRFERLLQGNPNMHSWIAVNWFYSF